MTLRRAAAGALALVLLPVLAGATGTTLEQRINAERAKAQGLQSRLHAKRVELHAVTLRYQDLQTQLAQTNAAIDTVSGRIDVLSVQQSSAQRRIDWNTTQLGAARRSLRLH
ncbi:MAG TPA: hypothetical protein VGM99_05210, partial [Candidatus Cybelea sp.]